MKVIGLTGGIGSGKTTISKMFAALGIPIYYADEEAKKLMNTSKVIQDNLILLFGEKAYQNNILNRAFIANIVFNDAKKLQNLNSIVHPEVNKHFKKWLENQEAVYIIQENAIIFESNNEAKFDAIITVTAPRNVKIERVMQRDSASEKMVLDRMNNQLGDAVKIEKSTYIIHNIDLHESKKSVLKIHNKLLK